MIQQIAYQGTCRSAQNLITLYILGRKGGLALSMHNIFSMPCACCLRPTYTLEGFSCKTEGFRQPKQMPACGWKKFERNPSLKMENFSKVCFHTYCFLENFNLTEFLKTFLIWKEFHIRSSFDILCTNPMRLVWKN
jgi:hypothetical protein